MRNIIFHGLWILIFFQSCSKDEVGISPLTGETVTYSFFESDDLEGIVEFAKRSDNSTQITIEISGTSVIGNYPAFFNMGTAANPTGILLVLSNVENGNSVTNLATLTDGSTLTYDELKEYDGNITIHKSNAELGTILLFSDIGSNELTTNQISYTMQTESLEEFAAFSIIERKNGNALGMVEMTDGIGNNYQFQLNDGTLIDDSEVILQMSPVNENGVGFSDIVTLDNGVSVSYEGLKEIAANIRAMDNTEYKAGADIGQNVFTERSISYELPSRSSEGISGTATIAERKNGTSMVSVAMIGTSAGVNHTNHIHTNNALDGGAIVISFNNVSGNDGISRTNITQMDDGTSITYEELLDFDGHIVVHPGTGQFNIIATGDIGQNQLTGEFEEYSLLPQTQDNVSGTVYFRQRKNNTTLVEMDLVGTTAGLGHETHIHQSTALTGGAIEISFNSVAGNTGISQTNITTMDDGTSINYDELINYDGHVVVHPNTNQFGIVARGDIGSNILTGESIEYPLAASGGSGVSGTVTFNERKSGRTMIEVIVTGTNSGDVHPNHIHENNATDGGSIVLDFNDVDGGTGISRTDAIQFNNGTPVTYEELIAYDGHVIVHHRQNFSTIAIGNIGSNGN